MQAKSDEVVGSSKEVENAMKYVFGNVLVADSPDTAKLVTFHPQVRVRAVTKEGDVYDPAGTVEGGSARDILQFSPNSHGIFSSLERCRFLRPEDACPQRFSWFFNWIPKVQKCTN